MGVFIYLDVAKNVSNEEWKPVYADSLKMAKEFPLYDLMGKEYYGCKLQCAVPSQEYEIRNRNVWKDEDEENRTGWRTVGDYKTMKQGEDFFFPKKLWWSKRERDRAAEVDKDFDAILCTAGIHGELEAPKEWGDCVKGIWFSKTQGEVYHMYLLAIACMVCDRLGRRAIVYGDISRGQCVEAARLAGECLGRTIPVPDNCDMKRLFDRIADAPMSERDKLAFFMASYLGNSMSMEFGQFIRDNFSSTAIQEYWTGKFRNIKALTYAVEDEVHRYLSLGFGLDELFSYITWAEDAEESLAGNFIEFILSMELYEKEKDCEDSLVVDMESGERWSQYTQLAQFFFAGARNWRVGRYIPLDSIKGILNEKMGHWCDVEAVFADYFVKKDEKSGSPADRMNDFMNGATSQLKNNYETYDISMYEELADYEEGDSIEPQMRKQVLHFYRFYISVEKEENYQELINDASEERCRFLIRNNRSVLLLEEEWESVFSRIEAGTESYLRYYPMVRVKVTSERVQAILRAFVTNDALWAYCIEHADEAAED